MKSRVGSVVVGLTVVVCILVFIGCSRQQESSGNLLSNVDEQPNACTLTEWTIPLLDQPAEFHRSKGKPVTETLEFSVPLDGELCVVVSNGLHDPPHGQRVSAAWISINGELVIGPDPFDQNTAEIRTSHTVTAGDHELSVRLASKPGSFLTVQLMLLARDEEPPVVSIEPTDGSQVDTDMPTITVSYSDDISGVDLNTLLIKLNGVDVTPMFSVSEDSASWALDISSYLEEGDNEIEASIYDNKANDGNAFSVFAVNTPTDALVADFESDDWRLRKRSAYKLQYRTDELQNRILRRCLRQLNDTPEPKAVDILVANLQTGSSDHIVRSLGAGAIGEAARADPSKGARSDVVDVLGEMTLSDSSVAGKLMAARALSLTLNNQALQYLDEFLETGPRNPALPEECDSIEKQSVCFDAAAHLLLAGFQVAKSAIRIAGHGHIVGNPGDIMEIWKGYMDGLETYLESNSGRGGAP